MYAKKIMTTGLLFLVLVISGCSGADTHDKLLGDTLLIFGEYSRILEGVSDEASAKAAAAELKGLKVEMDLLRVRAEKLGPASPEEELALKQKYEPEFKAMMTKFLGAAMKTRMYPELGEALKSASEPISGVRF